ncbi:MAG: hypothetical protein R3B60_00600 [Candidatus Paceibacterota bacterium]
MKIFAILFLFLISIQVTLAEDFTSLTTVRITDLETGKIEKFITLRNNIDGDIAVLQTQFPIESVCNNMSPSSETCQTLYAKTLTDILMRIRGNKKQ